MPTGDNRPAVSSQQLTELLRHRHPAPEWATFAELRAGTGYGVGRDQRLDFFAMNLYPMNKGQSIAYEIKVSRGDFTRELDHPDKRRFAESVATDCYFVMPHGLIKPDEVPEGWGLVELNAGGLQRTKLATQRKLEPWPLWFMLSLARRCSDPAPEIPAVLWKCAHKEVTPKDLLEIAQEACHLSIDEERAKIAKDAKAELLASSEYQRLHGLEKAADRITGKFYATGHDLQAWADALRGGPALDKYEVRELIEARKTLDRLIQSASPPAPAG